MVAETEEKVDCDETVVTTLSKEVVFGWTTANEEREIEGSGEEARL